MPEGELRLNSNRLALRDGYGHRPRHLDALGPQVGVAVLLEEDDAAPLARQSDAVVRDRPGRHQRIPDAGTGAQVLRGPLDAESLAHFSVARWPSPVHDRSPVVQHRTTIPCARRVNA